MLRFLAGKSSRKFSKISNISIHDTSALLPINSFAQWPLTLVLAPGWASPWTSLPHRPSILLNFQVSTQPKVPFTTTNPSKSRDADGMQRCFRHSVSRCTFTAICITTHPHPVAAVNHPLPCTLMLPSCEPDVPLQPNQPLRSLDPRG